jgi:hypothetical protein
MRAAYVLLVLGFLLLSPKLAWAVPAPMSPAELLAASDLVALVRVLAVTCTAVFLDGQTGQTLPEYRAELGILEVKKGAARRGETVIVTWREIPRGLLGPWVVRYYPGEEVWTHLQRDAQGLGYVTTWWNAKGAPVRPPDTNELPTRPGEVVRARFSWRWLQQYGASLIAWLGRLRRSG